MKRSGLWIFLLFAASLATLFPGSASAAAGTQAVSPNLFLVTGLPDAGNVVLLKTTEGVIVVDAGDNAEQGKDIVEAARSLGAGPIRYVILTQYHGDHTFGLQSFPPEAVIIGQDNISANIKAFSQADLTDYLERRAPQRLAGLRKEVESLRAAKSPDLAKKEEELKAAQERYDKAKLLRLAYPQVTFSRDLTIHLGGETVRAIYPGPTHTSCSIAVYFETQKVLHPGDLFFYRKLPYIDRAAGSDTANLIAALQGFKKLDFDKVVPGHGDVTTKAALDEQIDLLADLRSQVKAALAQGQSLEDMKRKILFDKWKGFGFFDILPVDIEAVYDELKK